MGAINLYYELVDDYLNGFVDFAFDYYNDPESGEQLFRLVYYVDWNNGQYHQGGTSDTPGVTEWYSFPADVDGQFRLEVGATEEWAWDTVVVVKNIIIATHATGDQTVVSLGGDDVMFGSAFADTVTLGDGNDEAKLGDGDDIVFGGAGVDMIDGQGGADQMSGGADGDYYYVNEVGDVVIEAAEAGTDLVLSAISYTLGDNVENLGLQGHGDLRGIGNNLNNSLYGNSGDNELRGRGGNDNLDGQGGQDWLYGGRGNDYYVIDADDRVVELADAGNDTVIVAFNYSLVNRPNLENIWLAGSININATGNESNNVLRGNFGSNVLNGRGGADRMEGGYGADTYIVDNVGDRVVEGFDAPFYADLVKSSITYVLTANVEDLTLTGADNIDGTGNAQANIIRGNSGDNTLKGGYGNDRLIGGAGNDTLNGGGDADRFVFRDGDGADTITHFQNDLDLILFSGLADVHGFDDLVLTDTGPGVLVDYGTGSILLANVGKFSAIGAEDFLFV